MACLKVLHLHCSERDSIETVEERRKAEKPREGAADGFVVHLFGHPLGFPGQVPRYSTQDTIIIVCSARVSGTLRVVLGSFWPGRGPGWPCHWQSLSHENEVKGRGSPGPSRFHPAPGVWVPFRLRHSLPVYQPASPQPSNAANHGSSSRLLSIF